MNPYILPVSIIHDYIITLAFHLLNKGKTTLPSEEVELGSSGYNKVLTGGKVSLPSQDFSSGFKYS